MRGECEIVICTFVGHREPVVSRLYERLSGVLEELAGGEDRLTFYVGGHSGFDSMGAEAVRQLKATHAAMDIRLILVLPYMTSRLNSEQCYASAFDEIFVLDRASMVHPKRAILVRNQWIVEQSDVIIACVQRDYGGAYQTLKYARQRGKRIVDMTAAK